MIGPMTKPIRSGAVLCTLLTLCLLQTQVHADYILSAPPRENPQAGKAMYGPLAAYLSGILKEPVIYKHPDSWLSYEKGMRAGAYDIVFDGPHFIAWRMEHLEAKPLVKLPGSLRFVLLSKKNQTGIQTPEDLIGKRICTLPTPHLGALSVFSMYPNPMQQPEFIPVRGGPNNLLTQFREGKCEGIILAKFVYASKINPQMRNMLRLLKESPPIANQGITVSKRISAQEKELIRSSLISGDGRQATLAMLKRFSQKNASFQAASEQDYAGQNLLRDNMIFGW